MKPLLAAYANANPKAAKFAPEYLTDEQMTELLSKGEKPAFVIDNMSRIENYKGSKATSSENALFGSDILQIAVPTGNPKRISGLTAFGNDPATRTLLCASGEPCGQAAEATLKKNNIAPAPDAFIDDARAVARELADNKADAAILFRTELMRFGKGKVEGLAIPEVEERVFVIMNVEPSKDSAALIDWIKRDKVAEESLTSTGLRPSLGRKPVA